MPGSNATPVYGWRYLKRYVDQLTYEAISGEDYLLGIEGTVSGVDARLAAVEAVATELGDPWTTYVPAWTSITGSNPVPATHSVTGRWRKVDSKLAVVEWRILGLSNSDWGTGIYGFGLPFTITADSRDMSCGSGLVINSLTTDYACSVACHSTTVVRMYNDTTSIGATTPFTLGTNDTIRGQIWVEPA